MKKRLFCLILSLLLVVGLLPLGLRANAAESMGMSTFYFSRQVKVLTGHTFLEYLTAYRIDKAKDLLQSTDMSVSDIGHSAGYSESNYFLRVFKRVTGMTPSTYRNQVKDEGK